MRADAKATSSQFNGKMTRELLTKEVQRLIAEGRAVIATEMNAGRTGHFHMGRTATTVGLLEFKRWQAGCKNLVRILGKCAKPWKATFDGKNYTYVATSMLGTLEAIEQSILMGLLLDVEDLVRAESFNSLLDQGDFLFEKDYFLAAGVLGRAVLEEHLRSWVAASSIVIGKPKPTLNDFKDALYKNGKFSVTVLQHIASMAAIGNDAAHNKPGLAKDEVKRLLRDVREFLIKNKPGQCSELVSHSQK